MFVLHLLKDGSISMKNIFYIYGYNLLYSSSVRGFKSLFCRPIAVATTSTDNSHLVGITVCLAARSPFWLGDSATDSISLEWQRSLILRFPVPWCWCKQVSKFRIWLQVRKKKILSHIDSWNKPRQICRWETKVQRQTLLVLPNLRYKHVLAWRLQSLAAY